MKLTNLRVTAVFIFLLIQSASCRKSAVISAVPERGGIAITFDDFNVDNWYTYLPVFDSLHVKCTFYVSNFNKLSGEQINKLHALQSHGHEIAFHSSNHINFVQGLQTEGYKKLMQTEVKQGIDVLNSNGFYPTTFAYPYGAHNLILDKGLLSKFKSVRILNGSHDLANSLVPLTGNTVIRGLGIDESSKRNFNHICDLLKSANDLNKCAVVLIHNIDMHGSNLQLPLWKLKNLITTARRLNLHFYTVSEISRK